MSDEKLSEFSHAKDSTLLRSFSGHLFDPNDTKWELDKDVTINLVEILKRISNEAKYGFINTLSHLAVNYSAGYTKTSTERILHLLRTTDASDISTNVLINYRSTLTRINIDYLGTIRTFIRKWHALGYAGIQDEVIDLLDGWRIQGTIKGDAVKRLDPLEGPLSDMELLAFTEAAANVYETGKISLTELALALIISCSGRRPVQISHMKIGDVISVKGAEDEQLYKVVIPRGKQRDGGFRDHSKPLAITFELWLVLDAQSKFVINEIVKKQKLKLTVDEQQMLPLFPNWEKIDAINTIEDLKILLVTDHLHILSEKITVAVKRIVDESQIQSERTGELLHVNARRFRYTTGTRAAREGLGELIIAELLDHSDTQNAGVYIKNIPEHVERLDQAVGFQMAHYAQAFAGVLVDSEKKAKRGNDLTSRIKRDGVGVGTCGNHSFCGASVPIPCYTCMHFQPWVDGPHQELYDQLISDRKRIYQETQDEVVSSVLDRTIVAVAEVIRRCAARRELKGKKVTHG